MSLLDSIEGCAPLKYGALRSQNIFSRPYFSVMKPTIVGELLFGVCKVSGVTASKPR